MKSTQRFIQCYETFNDWFIDKLGIDNNDNTALDYSVYEEAELGV